MKVKMCGITRPYETDIINDIKPDYIGIVMYFPKSKRNVPPDEAGMLIDRICSDVKKVAVTVSPTPEQIEEISELGFDIVQIHGKVDDNLIKGAKIPVWKAFNVKDMDMYTHYQKIENIQGYVFDAGEPGSGRTFDWDSLTGISRDDRLFVLAGGLTPYNVSKVIDMVHPDVVDVSSGIEYDEVLGVKKAGKDPEKMYLMIKKSRE